MDKAYNSSELAKQVSVKLKLSQAEGLELYKELSQIQNGRVKEALDMLTRPSAGKECGTAPKYAACIRSESSRDVQYEKHPGSDHLDDSQWVDAGSMPLFLKIIEADTPIRAKQMAAAYAGVDEGVIELYPVK